MNKVFDISIIVPVYNVEAYVREAVQSILNQSFCNYELILVDDGSTDGSGKICDEMAESDERIIVIHKKNEGVSKARNRGIEISRGTYIGFVDSDDIIHPLTLFTLHKLAKECNADICMSTGYLQDLSDFRESGEIVIYDRKQALDEIFSFSGNIPASACIGLYRAHIIKETGFSSEIHHWEDYTFQVLAISHSNVILTTTQQLYYYRQREGSANHTIMNDKVMTCLNIADLLKSYRVFRNELDVSNVTLFFISQCFFYFIRSTKFCERYKDGLIDEIHKNIGIILKSSFLSLKTKLSLLLFTVCPNLTKYICAWILNKD